MKMSFHDKVKIAAATGVVLSAIIINAAECVWQGGEGARWSDSSSWAGGVVPVEGDTARINSGVVVVTDADAEVVSSLTGIDIASKDVRLVFDNENGVNVNGYIRGAGGVIKLGTGTVFYNATDVHPSSTASESKDYNYGGTTVISNGMIRLTDRSNEPSGAVTVYMGGVTVMAPGVFCTATSAQGKQDALTFLSGPLNGDGTVINTSTSGGPYQLRLNCKNPAGVFSGKMTGRIRHYSSGTMDFTGVDNDFPGFSHTDSFAVQGGGSYGVMKIGNKSDLTSSMGRSSQFLYREGGGTFRYLGEGETTDKDITMNGFGNGASSSMTFDAGATGGIIFNGKWSEGPNDTPMVHKIVLTGSNTVPCQVNGEYAVNSKSRSAYVLKTGSGTWRFNDNGSRRINGVFEVKEGTLQFETIQDKGYACSLGVSTNLCLPASSTNNKFGDAIPVDYAFLLGSPENRPAVFEYVGSHSSICLDRPAALAGAATIKTGAAGSLMFEGVSAASEGEKTLTLDVAADAATSYLAKVSDGAGKISIVKTGSGTWGLYGTNTLTGSIKVNEGTLMLGTPPAPKYTYFRLTVKEIIYARTGGTDSNTEIQEFALYDKDGNRRNVGLNLVAYNAALGEGEMQFNRDDSKRNYYTSRDADKLVDDVIGVNPMCITYGPKPTASDPGTWFSLTMRLSDDTPEITSYDICNLNGRQGRSPCAYSVEGSIDGINWRTLADVSIPTENVANGNCWYSDGTSFASGAVRTGFEFSNDQFAPCEIAGVSAVSVAAGATLQGGVSVVTIPAIEIDCAAGAGTIKDVAIAPTGTLFLKNFYLGASYALPMTFDNVNDLANMRNWSVSINGTETKNKRIAVSSNNVSVTSVGTILIIR